MKPFTIILFIFISFSTKAQCKGSAILCNKTYNNVAYLTTHNSFNSEEGNFSLPNQNFNINTQLNNDVRALMLDVYDSGGIPMVYHGSAILGSNPLIDYLNQIHLFLSNNTNEIVTIILECYTDANAIESVINQSGLNSFLYTHDSTNSWPTLQTMINNNTRLVMFSDVDDASANQQWYHYIWDYAVETHYSVNNQNDFNCDFNRGDSINELFIFNHFVTTVLGTGDENASSAANSNPFFLSRVLQCQQEKNKFPNFITVDFYDLGSTNEVVNFLNRGTLIPAKVTGENSLESDDLGTIKGNFIKHYPKGSDVKLLIQPEDLEHDDGSNLKLEVVDRQFRGTNFIYTLKTPRNLLIPLFVHSHHIHQHEVDEKFGIKRPINIDHIVCF